MRPICSSCQRPARVCLCAELPAKPIHTATTLVILQHPHETRHKLATVPIIARCLSNCHIIVGRRLQLGTSRLLDAFASTISSHDNETAVEEPVSSTSCSATSSVGSARGDQNVLKCKSCGQRKCVLLLFPTDDAVELGTWLATGEKNACHQSLHRKKGGDAENAVRDDEEVEQVASSAPSSREEMKRRMGTVCSEGKDGHFILLVLDGTWQHAKEMVKASMPFLGAFVEQVCLPHDTSREGWGMGDSNSIIRKEPFAGCVSTLEAVAGALAILELDGMHVEQTLLSVLRQLVRLQATHFTPMKPRPRLSRKHT